MPKRGSGAGTFRGKPCPKCHSCLRYNSTRACVQCNRASYQEQREAMDKEQQMRRILTCVAISASMREVAMRKPMLQRLIERKVARFRAAVIEAQRRQARAQQIERSAT